MSALGIGKLGLGAAGAAAVVALIAGCSSGSSPAQPAANGSSAPQSASSAPSGASAASGSASTLKTMSTSIGTVLVDSSGRTVYELVGDTAAMPTCNTACLAVWPAVMANGTQVVVNGHPAFTFVEDSAAGQTKGQNVTDQFGKWLALDASGNPISAAASSSAPSSPAPATSAQAPSGGGAAF